MSRRRYFFNRNSGRNSANSTQENDRQDSDSESNMDEDEELLQSTMIRSQNENESSPPPEFVRLPGAREHSYLPGASHPLGLVATSRTLDANSVNQDTTFELAVLELCGVVLLPGAKIPIRLYHRSWHDYLGSLIAASRAKPGENIQVRLGIITKRRSDGETGSGGVERRRQSWTRQGYGPARLRRLSQQLIQELGDIDDLSDDSSSINSSTGNSSNNFGNSARRTSRQRYGAESLTASTTESSNEVDRWSNTGDPPRVYPPRNDIDQFRKQSVHVANNATSSSNDRLSNRYVGQIGTIATVIYTHGEVGVQSVCDSSTSINIHEEELVITALGTGRFRIVMPVEDISTVGIRSSIESRHLNSQQKVKRFIVQELDEHVPALQQSWCPLRQSLPVQGSRRMYDIAPQSLHHVTAIPQFVYNSIWPERLKSLIIDNLKNTPAFAGIYVGLKEVLDQFKTTDPSSLAYWLTANLSFTIEERQNMVEMRCTAERLQYIYKKLEREKKADSKIHCRMCMIPLSTASNMFTLGGAEGTTGNYVNEHGAVHQTVTIREIAEAEVWYTGSPQTRDSWFPGYSWQIMSCGFCGAHLGWKFVRLRFESAEDRPIYFYGLSAANISTLPAMTRE